MTAILLVSIITVANTRRAIHLEFHPVRDIFNMIWKLGDELKWLICTG